MTIVKNNLNSELGSKNILINSSNSTEATINQFSQIDLHEHQLLQKIERAVQCLTMNENQQGLLILKEVIPQKTDMPELLYAQAVAEMRLGLIQDAKGSLGKLLLRNPSHFKGRELLEIANQVAFESNQSVAQFSGDSSKNTTKLGGLKCLFLNTYYDQFLANIYNRHSCLQADSYVAQKRILQQQAFGDSDFYSEGLKATGWIAEDIIMNCEPLNQAWAKEHSCSFQGWSLLLERIRNERPDVVYCQDMHTMSREMLSSIRPYVKLIVGQNASPLGDIPIELYDVVFSSYPFFVNRFREKRLPAYLQPLAFDERILKSIQNVSYSERSIACSFIGGLSRHHQDRFEWLDYLAMHVPLEFWGYGVESTGSSSPLRKCYKGEAWGVDMFAKLLKSKITVNKQAAITYEGQIVNQYATNMRLYEATGCGALLITEYKDNLPQLFEIGKEIVVYRSKEECVGLIKYYLNHPDEAEKIAKAGQQRTLRDHTYRIRMQQTAEVLQRHLRYQREEGSFESPDLNKISYGHTNIQANSVSTTMTNAWHHPSIPRKQRALVQQTLKMIYKGNVPRMCQILADLLRPIVNEESSLLEIGCSSAYYYEILEYLLSTRLNYTGVDYSEPMINMARDYYSRPNFYVADGAQMPFENKKFDITISSCVILHTPNYREHIRETIRVASKYVIFHRTPICRVRPTQYFKKYAYEVETVELMFNEGELFDIFSNYGLRVLKAIDHSPPEQPDTYVCDYLLEKSL
jgi:ubiquinone/menaquinone biosynthesis C-methylase UbiE